MTEHTTMLKCSRTVCSTHKAIIQSNDHKPRKNVNMNDEFNTETHNYHNQSNIDNMVTAFNNNKESLLSVCSFQKQYTKSWNSRILEVSQLLYLNLSKFNELSNDGSIQILVEFRHDFGLSDKGVNK